MSTWPRAGLLTIASTVLLGLLVLPQTRTTSAPPDLRFEPLIAVAPDQPADSLAGPFACTTPPPVRHSASFHCYAPSDILTAYGVDQLHSEGLTGAGETIVIVDSYGSPTAQQDLDAFSDTFGLPRTTIDFIYPDGTPPFNNSVNGSPAGWAFETSLDLQWAHAIAPGAHLVLVAANPAETQGVQGFPGIFKGESMAIQRYPGSVLSQSFAVTEQSFQGAAAVQVQLLGQVYKQAASSRVTVLGSSGDSGTANTDKQGRLFPFPTVNWPSSDPMVTSAGGTWLQLGWTWNPTGPTDPSYLNTPGSRTEGVWNEPFIQAATGGGLSALFPTPGFQSGIPQSLLHGSRGLPDVSWNAAVDGGVLVYTSFPGTRVGWHIVGGTSASSPQLAGVVALANQLADIMGKKHVGYLNPFLYSLPATDFTDILPHTFGAVTIADNSNFGSGVAGMPATPGYDLATGFGSPKAHAFVHDLVALLP